MDPSARHLVLHGAIVLFIGLACGGPYGRAINRNAPAQVVQSWRLAHASLPMGGILMIAVAALLSNFSVQAYCKWLIALTLIVSSYAFCVSLPMAAVVGHRGLSSQGPLAAKLVFAGNLVGAWMSAVATLGLIYAAFVSL
jgi:vacuolar-type H+-ATPase subunit I/STV1